MVLDDVQVGEVVRIRESGARGIIREIDRPFFAARVEMLSSGVDRWWLLDQIEPVAPWYERRRTEAW